MPLSDYQQYDNYLVNPAKGITVYFRAASRKTDVIVDGLLEDDCREWVLARQKAFPSESTDNFILALEEWVRAQRQELPGIVEEDSCLSQSSGTSPDFDFWATGDWPFDQRENEFSVSGVPRYSRPLKVYTWGRALRSSAPQDSQRTFNAAVLNGKGKGVDLRTMNGLCPEIQRVISKCSIFPSWLSGLVKRVEDDNLHTVSVICTKGRHRSVAAAELLRHIYPNIEIHHLTIR